LLLGQGVENLPDTQQKHSSTAWQKQLSGVARSQFVAAVMVSVFALFWQGEVIAISLLSGGTLVGLNSVLLARSVVSSSQEEVADGRSVLYRSAVVRFLLLIVALIGANLMGLHLLAVAAGMFMAYVGGYIYIVRVTSRASDVGRADES
jgi:F0F1-type ATP synthase assembly protein I